ncbi:hypothetical protein FPSE_02707 [Fusarium pseudograminearum CS3096]|uniref:R3H domain-containing protein n=1 Tax=Fusarium pseudograminearum (strain CS3096) TaxID=1028729 RepID=K3VSL2_FUSPC|nr:hypothetical protein FPSE_02707 [Fusarium pseudograminearum CS3096]EKJ77063.1 hypothetical protein FPSE_02707 [Fusarium pseudograminearum CS3096]
MAEQEPNCATNQAQSETQNRPQNEGQGSASGSRGGSRGGRRRGRGGRSRGQRQDGPAQGPGGRGNTSQTESTTAPATAPTEPAASAAPESSGNPRNRRNRRGNRGAARGAARGSVEQSRGVFTMGPRRQFGGRLTTNEQSSDAADQDASLRANAPEFVPGQPAPQRGNGQQSSGAGESQSAAQPRSRGNRTKNRKQDRPRQEVPKSTASELWQRIQEDIANWNYECRICTEELCGKAKPLCGHSCQSVCHGQTACNESTACQVKMTVKCPCGNHKKEFKCLTSTSNPTPNRPEVRCDEECERLDRNRRLAAALNIDPATHTNDHVPFSDDTLKLYKQFSKWGDEQESQYRVFAANKDEVRLRYEPMKNVSRQFLHLLAEDFGFESKSEDHDIHRSVLVWKTDKFVSAPPKTLSQCVKIRATQAAEAAAAAAIRPPSPPVLETEPFNALVLTEPRFGLTNDDVNTALAADLSSLQGFSFKVDFLNDEVLIKATVSYSAFLTPAPIEKSLEVLKPRIEQTIRREKLAENVLLCHSDVNGAITRREVPRRAGAGGWSAVAGRAASKPGSSSATEEAKPGRKLLGLKKKKLQVEAGKVWAALDGDVEC